jgi:hypothetical protein
MLRSAGWVMVHRNVHEGKPNNVTTKKEGEQSKVQYRFSTLCEFYDYIGLEQMQINIAQARLIKIG